MPEVTPGQAFLWLLRRASHADARAMIDRVLSDPNQRWSEIVEKNLAPISKSGGNRD